MRATIAHRGPDGVGAHVAEGVALGHRRLSIIDLQGGQQPLSNEDGSVWITFNGEIYNYRDLTTSLERRGHQFRTRSDTEVVVHAYEEYGLEFPRHLNGMFALALHDLRRRRVVLVRDHLGIKPLFYAVTPEGLFFASEIKAVLAGTGHAPSPRRESLAEYMAFRYIAGSQTFFEGIHRLPPGHLAVWEHGALRVQRFWAPRRENGSHAASLEEATDALDAHLARSVSMQMMSEVPLGTFCSGGVDSGLVTGYAARESRHRLKTFSVGLDDPAWDESALAADTASRFGTDHHAMVARPEDIRALLPQLIWHHDEPLSHPNSVPLFLLSRFARQHVTVVLTGEGSDELFAGYPRYHIARLRGALDALPPVVRRALSAAARRLPGHRAARLADQLPLSLDAALIYNSVYVHPEVVGRLVGFPVEDALADRRRLLDEARVPGDVLATLSQYELSTYLVCALDRMDRMSMASGLEGRVPFLDVPLVEWGLHLQSGLRSTGTQNKRVVKRLAERTLSRRITRGAKSGFGLPLGDWFRRGALTDLLSRVRDPEHPAAEYFERGALQRIIGEHARGAADHGEVLWHLINVYLWCEVHLAAAGVESPRVEIGAAAPDHSVLRA